MRRNLIFPLCFSDFILLFHKLEYKRFAFNKSRILGNRDTLCTISAPTHSSSSYMDCFIAQSLLEFQKINATPPEIFAIDKQSLLEFQKITATP